MDSLIAASTLVIHLIFDAYIFILLLRLLLQKLRASWHNPVSQFIIQLTEKPLKPFRKLLPGVHGFDLSIMLVAVVLQLIEVMLLWMMHFGGMPNIQGSLIITVAEILSKFIHIAIFTIIVGAIASWFPQAQTHPAYHIVYLITEPLLSPIRRFIPLIAGIDISPVVALLVLTLINMLVVQPLVLIGTKVVLG